MVPQDIYDIGPAIEKALERLEAQLKSDRASVAADRDRERSASGVAALDAVLEAAEALKTQLCREPPPAST